MGTSATTLSARTYLPNPKEISRSGITFILTKLYHAHRPHSRYIYPVRASDQAQRLVGDGVELRRHDRANYPLYARWYSDEEIWRLTSWAAEPMPPEAVKRLFEEREKSSV